MGKFPTPEEVQASIEATLEKLAPQEEILAQLINREPKEISELPIPAHEKNIRMRAVVNVIHSIVAPHTVCSKGCGHCCKMAVTITSWEAEQIGKAIGVEPKKVPSNFNQERMVKKYMGVPCTFLKKGVCQIYEHRPLACRTHYNLSAYPELCDVVEHPGNDVPNLNFRNIWMADSMNNVEGSDFNDLREFFPDGLNPVESL